MEIKVCKLEAKEEYIKIKGYLTNKQLEYINLIEEFKMEHKKVPSIREICKLKGNRNCSATLEMLQRLYKKGYNYKEI